jgi:cytochrome c oxidase subunit II
VNPQSVLNPAGPQAAHIQALWWVFVAITGAVFLIVVAVLLWSLTRRHRGIEQEPLERTHIPTGITERRLARSVAAATTVTILILFGLLIASIGTGRAISQLGDKTKGITIEVVGNQWWWYVRYLNDDPSRIVVTANEIHIPVGRPVQIRGTSNDVIHSFWVPNLHGKRDLIPSRITTEWIQADRPGRYRGQCAEFCGLQHAHMILWVIAEEPARFEAWMDRQLQPAVQPAGPAQLDGQQAFLKYACVFCHTIQGTPAAGQMAPDLTHFGSRSTLAAGTLPNTKGNLAAWIADPQNIKPGNHMAMLPIQSQDLQPIVEYLDSLQ